VNVMLCPGDEAAMCHQQAAHAQLTFLPTPISLTSGYDRRKYVWKLLYIYMLGYDIEFGHKQAADLIPLTK